MTTGPLGLDAALWGVLACPCPQHAPVVADELSGQIACTKCDARFNVLDGIPIMLLDATEQG
ncbi:hypothetical protein LBMAG15_06810 [Actinomycetes bacterium]|nr:hypothetical protein LBMAG15_06810 [Actinomycetes bacterium]